MSSPHNPRLHGNDSDKTDVQDTNVITMQAVQLSIEANEQLEQAVIDSCYNEAQLLSIAIATLDYINEQVTSGVILPYFADMDSEQWHSKPKAIDIYVTDAIEGQALNLEARGKDYATNILSYPSDLPAALFELMPMLPLGELIICHEVIVREAAEQHKSISQHISHLLVHGVLHLLGFDHELGQMQQEEMEQFEIAILASLALPNPYS